MLYFVLNQNIRIRDPSTATWNHDESDERRLPKKVRTEFGFLSLSFHVHQMTVKLSDKKQNCLQACRVRQTGTWKGNSFDKDQGGIYRKGAVIAEQYQRTTG